MAKRAGTEATFENYLSQDEATRHEIDEVATAEGVKSIRRFQQ
jgi:hypothetical protein